MKRFEFAAAVALALAASLAGAQTAPRAAGTSGTAGAGTTAEGSASAGGALPEGTGSNGRAIIILSQPPSGSGTNVMGAGASPPRGGRLSAVEIASLFLSADTNRDGELSRAEAARIQLPMSFDDLDTNHDGVLSRFEFDEAFR